MIKTNHNHLAKQVFYCIGFPVVKLRHIHYHETPAASPMLRAAKGDIEEKDGSGHLLVMLHRSSQFRQVRVTYLVTIFTGIKCGVQCLLLISDLIICY